MANNLTCKVNTSNDKAELCEKIMSVELFGHCYYRFQALSKYILFNARQMFHL